MHIECNDQTEGEPNDGVQKDEDQSCVNRDRELVHQNILSGLTTLLLIIRQFDLYGYIENP